MDAFVRRVETGLARRVSRKAIEPASPLLPRSRKQLAPGARLWQGKEMAKRNVSQTILVGDIGGTRTRLALYAMAVRCASTLCRSSAPSLATRPP